MLSKANPAEVTSRVTWTIRLCSFTAIGAWTGDIQCLTFPKLFRVRVPFSLLFLPLRQHMASRTPGRMAWRNAATTLFTCILFVIICITNFCQKSNVGSGFSSFACAQACPAFTSGTNNKKVNCRFGHHFISHVYSNPIGSWQRLLMSSTQCFTLLCRLKGSVYRNDFHSPSTHHQVE